MTPYKKNRHQSFVQPELTLAESHGQTASLMEREELWWLLLIALVLLILLFLCPNQLASTGFVPDSIDNCALALTAASNAQPSRQTAFAFSIQSPGLQPPTVARSGEEETRAALVRIFGKPFGKVRPPFLVNPETKRRLELDCFNDELRLGVEFSGSQHFVFPNPFHHTQAEFDAQQRRDRYKAQQCQQAGIQLIVVPYTVPRPMIESYLRQQLQNLNFVGVS